MSATKLDHLAQRAAATLMLLAPFALVLSMVVLVFRGLESGYFTAAGGFLLAGTSISLISRIIRLLVGRLPLLTRSVSMLRHAFNVGAYNVLFFGCVAVIMPTQLLLDAATDNLAKLVFASALACVGVFLACLLLTVLILIWTGRTVFTRDTAQLVMEIMRQAK